MIIYLKLLQLFVETLNKAKSNLLCSFFAWIDFKHSKDQTWVFLYSSARVGDMCRQESDCQDNARCWLHEKKLFDTGDENIIPNKVICIQNQKVKALRW